MSSLFSSGCPTTVALVLADLFTQEVTLGSAVILTFVGMALHWRMPQQRSSLEERVKDGNLTEAKARQMMQLYAWGAPVATLIGAALLAVAVYLMRR